MRSLSSAAESRQVSSAVVTRKAHLSIEERNTSIARNAEADIDDKSTQSTGEDLNTISGNA